MPLKENSMPNKVYDGLKEEILYLKLEPGQIISEIETAKIFNVSRTPVRDAFKRLEAEGLLEIKSHIGTYVSLIDLDQIADIMYMREKLELSVMNDLMNTLTQVQIFRINLILVKQKELLDRNVEDAPLAKEFIDLDNEFHATLFDLAGKARIWSYLSSVEHHYDRFRMFINLSDRSRLNNLYEEHIAIFEAIKDKKPEIFTNIFSNHLYAGIQNSTQKIFDNSKYFANFKVE